MTNRDELAISENELGAMTTELDMLHKETFPAVQKTFGDLRANLSHLRTRTGRDTGRPSCWESAARPSSAVSLHAAAAAAPALPQPPPAATHRRCSRRRVRAPTNTQVT